MKYFDESSSWTEADFERACERMMNQGMREPEPRYISLTEWKQEYQPEIEREKMSQNINNAVSDMKRQLRGLSKSEIIRQWIGLYAQVVNLAQQNEELKKQLNQATVPGGTEGKKND